MLGGYLLTRRPLKPLKQYEQVTLRLVTPQNQTVRPIPEDTHAFISKCRKIRLTLDRKLLLYWRPLVLTEGSGNQGESLIVLAVLCNAIVTIQTRCATDSVVTRLLWGNHQPLSDWIWGPHHGARGRISIVGPSLPPMMWGYIT